MLILATLVWPAWLEPRLKFACAATALLLWLAAAWETRGELRRIAAERAETDETAPPTEEKPPGDELLSLAQRHYLRGDLVAAEKGLRKAIRLDRDDFESRFWLVAVLRSGGRLRQAERLLRRVESRDAARGWRTEIADERKRLEQLIAAAAEPTILPMTKPLAGPREAPGAEAA